MVIGNCYSISVLYRDNGKENGNYYNWVLQTGYIDSMVSLFQAAIAQDPWLGLLLKI